MRKLSTMITIGALAIAVGAVASCDRYHDKKSDTYGTYGKTPPPKCEKVAPTPISVSQPSTPAERAACEAAGGIVRPEGLAGFEACVLPFCDAGEVCSDSSECIGKCFTGPGFAGGIGTATTGFCQPDSSPFGCRTEVLGGQAGPTLCVD